jgi:hypothetical protein
MIPVLAIGSVGGDPLIGRVGVQLLPFVVVERRALDDVLRIAGEALPGGRVFEHKHSNRDQRPDWSVGS